MGIQKYSVAVTVVLAILLCVTLALVGGPLNGFDNTTVDALAAERVAHPFVTHAAIWISLAGSAPATLILSFLGAAFLLRRSQLSRSAMMFAIVLGGRLMVDVLKLWISRPRPDLGLHGVTVHSLSFPSGHAANSMIAFVALALFCAPERHRKAALTLAIAASLLVGATRPLLGVHWPSDVLAGWIFGLLWTVGWWQLASRFDSASPA